QVRAAIKDLPRPKRHWTDHFEDDSEEVDVVYYSAPAYVVRDRLELRGYTLAMAKAAFTKRIRIQAELENSLKFESAEVQDLYKARATLLSSLDVDQWLATLLHIKQSGLGTLES